MSEPEGETTTGCANQEEIEAPMSAPNVDRLEREKEFLNTVGVVYHQNETVSVEPANGSSASDSGDQNLNNNSDVGKNIEITATKELCNTTAVPTVAEYSGNGMNNNQYNAEASDNMPVASGLIIDACSSHGIISTDPSTSNGKNNELNATDATEHTRTSSEDFVNIPPEDLIKGKINSDSVTSSVDTVEMTDRCLSDGCDVRNTSEIHENGISSVLDANESNQGKDTNDSMRNKAGGHDKDASTQLPSFGGDKAETQVEQANTIAVVNRSNAEVTQSIIDEKSSVVGNTDADLLIPEQDMGNIISLTSEEKTIIDNSTSGIITSTRTTPESIKTLVEDETPKEEPISHDQIDPLDVQARMFDVTPVNIRIPETNDGETCLTIAAQHESVLTDSTYPAEANVIKEDDTIVQSIRHVGNDKIEAKQLYSEMNATDNCTDLHHAEQEDIASLKDQKSSNELPDLNNAPQRPKSEITEMATISDDKQSSEKVQTANDQFERIESTRKVEVQNGQKDLSMKIIDKSRGGSQAREDSLSGKPSYRKETSREDKGTESPKGNQKERFVFGVVLTF